MDIASTASAALFFAAAPVVSAGVGWVYFAQTEKRAPLIQRLASSAYGPSIAALFLVVLLLVPSDFRFAAHVQFFFWLQIIPAALLVYSLAKYPGPKRSHLLLLLALPCWVWLVVFGALKIHGE